MCPLIPVGRNDAKVACEIGMSGWRKNASKKVALFGFLDGQNAIAFLSIVTYSEA